MNHSVLLVSTDVALAERVRRALPLGMPLDLHTAAVYRAAPAAGRNWLLALVDAHAPLPMSPPAASGEAVPVLWLGELPRVAAPDDGRRRAPGPILDYLDRAQSSSKLSFVLHQHLAAAYLRRVRHPAPHAEAVPIPTEPAELQAQINNALAGILGNAELAAELARSAGRRMPPLLLRRLQSIVDLAMQMRELLLPPPVPS
ncbi:MAG: hypothetical protein ACRD1E_00885 [Terriglobales bacterium]